MAQRGSALGCDGTFGGLPTELRGGSTLRHPTLSLAAGPRGMLAVAILPEMFSLSDDRIQTPLYDIVYVLVIKCVYTNYIYFCVCAWFHVCLCT